MPTNPQYPLPLGSYAPDPATDEASAPPPENFGSVDQDGGPPNTTSTGTEGPAIVPSIRMLWSKDAVYQANGQITTDYAAVVSYQRDEGMRVYPVAGTDTSGAQSGVVVQEHCPVELAVIQWSAISSGGLPRLPDPRLADSNFVLFKRSVNNPVPVVGSSGAVRRFIVTGTYIYAMKVPGGVVRDFPGLGNALDTTARTANTIPATQFDKTLVF